MRLAGFRVSNHSRLEDLDIAVRDHLVLVGPNDAGKSSLLRCMDLVLGASAARLYSRLGAADFRDRGKALWMEAILENFDDDDRAWFPDEIAVDPAVGSESLTIRLTAEVDDSDTLTILRSAPSAGTGRQLSPAQVVHIGWKIIGAVARARDLRSEGNTALDDILKSVDLGPEREAFAEITERLGQQLATSQILEELRSQLASQLSKALPRDVETTDLSFVPGAAADDDVLSGVRLQIKHRGELRNLAEQSDGTRALFAIALYDLVSASANIVGIDEPEMHLHPTSQRSLAQLFRTGGNQKIVATHSADIVGIFPPEYIVTIKPGGRVIQPQTGFLSGRDRMVVQWWVRDRLEPLTAARIIGVEGVSDRIIVQRAAEVTARELDRRGISIIETGGAGDMGAIVSLFGNNGFQVDMSLLIDEDAVDDTATKVGVDKTDFAARSIWVSTPDLEGEYVTALGASRVWSAIENSGLFSQNELDNCEITGADSTRTNEDVADFCRRRKSGYKVRAAIAVSGVLTADDAAKIRSIEHLLNNVDAAILNDQTD